jgi:hypothetical protein
VRESKGLISVPIIAAATSATANSKRRGNSEPARRCGDMRTCVEAGGLEFARLVQTSRRILPGRAGTSDRNTPGTFVSLAGLRLRATVNDMEDMVRRVDRPSPSYGTAKGRLFYGVFLPLGVVANIALGVLILAGLRPDGWPGWLQIGTGAFCCVVAGWLAAAAWSKFYWNNAMARQVAVWHRIADAFFGWLEEVPVPAEALKRLKTSLDEAVPNSQLR